LKNLSAEQQEAIAEYGATHSITQTRDWIVLHHNLNPGRTAVGHFLASARMIDQRYENKGAVHGLLTKIESDAPDLSPEELQARAKVHFAETVINDSNVSAFNQSERNAIRREELEIQRQEVAIQREEMQVQRERLKLAQEKFQRDHVESIVNTASDPKVLAVAQNGKLSYAQKVAEADKIMFGDK
jgi:hypothetical protein